MLFVLIFFLATIFSIAYFYISKNSSVMNFFKNFDRKYRVSEDYYLVGALKYFISHLIINSIFIKRFSLWYEFEKISKDPRFSNKIAIVYARPLPDKNIKIDGDSSFSIERITYGELYNAILRMSFILANDFKVQKGDVVAMYFMNKPLFVIIWFSLWNIGAIPSFLNYNLVHAPLIHSIKIVDSKVLLVDSDCNSNFETTKTELIISMKSLSINLINEFEMMEKISNPSTPVFRQNDEIRDYGVRYWDPAVLVYTSGTTGLPKSAVNSWRKAYFASTLFPFAMRINSKSNIYTSMPLYHGTASILGVLPALMSKGTISLGHKFSLSSYWTQVKLTNANTIQYVGEVCRYLVDSDETLNEKNCYGKIKLAYGNGLRPDIWMKLKERFKIPAIGEFYSSSEAPFATTCFEHNGIGVGAIRNNGWLADKILSLQYTLVRMDPEDDNSIYRNEKGFCVKPKVGEKGEMIMRILNPKNIKATFPGYVNNDQATYSKIIRNVFKTGDAWVRSDDLMKYDEIGCIYFVDRMGDTFRWKSENVSTTEVENQILENVPEIKQCVVVGAKVENHEGRCGYALIQTINDNKENNSEKTQLLQKLSDCINNHLPHFARPCFLRFEKIELTENHKISKKRFRDPALPNGISGTQEVYYLDSKCKKYLPLDSNVYNEVISGKIRL